LITVEVAHRMDPLFSESAVSIGDRSVRKRLTYQPSPTGNEQNGATEAYRAAAA